MYVPTHCRSGHIQGCILYYYSYRPYTTNTNTPYTTGTHTPFPTPTATATTTPAVENNTGMQENSRTSADAAVVCLAIISMLIIALVPWLAEIRHHKKMNKNSCLEEELAAAQKKVNLLAQEIANQHEEHAALQTEKDKLEEGKISQLDTILSLRNSRHSLQARYKDLLAGNNELAAHNHNLNVQNHNVTALNADLMHFIHILGARNTNLAHFTLDLQHLNLHLKRETINWKNTFHAIHTPPPQPIPTPAPVSPPNPAPMQLETALQECLVELVEALSRKEGRVRDLEEEVGDFEKEVEWRDELIEVVEEELADVKGMLEWYKGGVDEMGRWALGEGGGFEEGVEEGVKEGDGDGDWEGFESGVEEVGLRDFEGVEDGAEDLDWEYVEVV